MAVAALSTPIAAVAWEVAPGEHVWVGLTLDVNAVMPRRGPSTWRCSNKEEYHSFVEAQLSDELTSVGEFNEAIADAMGRFRETSSQHERRAETL